MVATNTREKKNIDRAREQVDAIRLVSKLGGESSAGALALDGALRLEAWADRQERKLQTGAAHEIDLNASDVELREARVRQAVKRADDIYLPICRAATVGFPNLLLRSELFGSSIRGDECAQEMLLASYGDTAIRFTGLRLTDYDRRVFGACLRHYQLDNALSDGSQDSGWIRATFYQLSQALGVSYGENVHNAIRSSLIRLNAAHLQIRAQGRNIPVSRLLQVHFEDAEPSTRSKGGIAFRVFDSMASLFGPADWTSVSLAVLNGYTGLAAWLAAFYSTHKSAYPIRIADLYRLSGVLCTQREFRRRLKNSLARLQGDDAPESVRIARVEFNGSLVTVDLHRWQ